nr:MAG TPA: hypothetical protein [Bacteriophage sp.]
MPVHDHNGTTSTQISKIYDNNGTTSTQIGKVYDNNGTANTLIFSSDMTLFDAGKTVEYTGGWNTAIVSGASFTFIVGQQLKIQQINYAASTSAKIISKAKIAISGFSTLKFTYTATKGGNGTFTFGLSPVTTDWDVYDTAANLTRYARLSTGGSGTASVNVSGISGSYYVRLSVFGSTGNSTLSVTKIWLE